MRLSKNGYAKGFYNKNEYDAEIKISGILYLLFYKIEHENLTLKKILKWLFDWRYGEGYYWNLQNNIWRDLYGDI